MRTTYLWDLFSLEQLDKAIEAGYVREQRHPDHDHLRIFNYTAKAAYEGVWNAVTTQCRGLIATTGCVVVARPWPKFHNYGDPAAHAIPLSARVEVTDKLDGSLGILYPTPDGWAIATRGSFASPQALHATEVLRTRYPDFAPPDGLTALVEIVYPENRVVPRSGSLSGRPARNVPSR